MRRFNRSVSFRRVCRYTFTLIPFLAMQEFNTFKTFCRVAETAEKPTAEKPTIGRCLNTVKNVSQTASIALPISGQEPHSTGEYKACAGASNQPQTQPGLSLNLFPARQFVVSRIRKTMGRPDLPCWTGQKHSCPDFNFPSSDGNIHNCMYC